MSNGGLDGGVEATLKLDSDSNGVGGNPSTDGEKPLSPIGWADVLGVLVSEIGNKDGNCGEGCG